MPPRAGRRSRHCKQHLMPNMQREAADSVDTVLRTAIEKLEKPA
jgi:hypothetical protein